MAEMTVGALCALGGVIIGAVITFITLLRDVDDDR